MSPEMSRQAERRILTVIVMMITCYANTLSAQEIIRMKPIPLESLSGEGVEFEKRIRLRVRDIKIGGRGALPFFQVLGDVGPSKLERALGLNHDIRIALKPSYSQLELRRVFLEEYADDLVVELRDERDIFFKGLIPETQFRKNVVFPVDISQTPCETITKIIYEAVDDRLNQVSIRDAQTEATVSLDDVYSKLLTDQLEPFLDTLDAVQKNHPCFDTFELLKWLRGDEIYGFEWAKYRVHSGLLDLLVPTVKAIGQVRESWELYDFEIRCVGYADPDRVLGIRIDRQEAGIEDWDSGTPFDVFYQGCEGDSLLQKKPRYVAYGSSAGQRITFIEDNCQLGAARAYVLSTYLMLTLGPERTEFKYATGGVMSEHKENELNRRVNLEMIMKSARE